MTLRRIKLQIIEILGTHDNYGTRFKDCFSLSHVLSEGESFDKVVEEKISFLIEENGFEGHVKDIVWIDDTNASIRFDKNEYTVLCSLKTQYVTINID